MTTFSSKESAFQFAKNVVEKKYAKCINVIEGVTSIYHWKEKLENTKEILVLGKTTRQSFKRLKKDIKDLHPYELPELISFKIEDGLPDYLSWIIQ